MRDRQHARVALAVEVEYRTAGAFLVAYSANLSKGGVFLETSTPSPIGTELTLRFAIPGAGPIEVRGLVAWVRSPGDPEAKPPGMGVEFEDLDVRHGELIDEIAISFKGLCVLVLASTAHGRTTLARAVRSVLATAEVIEAADAEAAEHQLLRREPDLVLCDLDAHAADGLLTLRLAKSATRTPLPVIVMARDEATRVQARELGADDVLAVPATLADLQAAVLQAICRPLAVR